MANIFTSNLATFSISTTSTDPATFDASGYGALTFEQACPMQSFGAFGTSFNPVTFENLCSGLLEKLKGTRDNGDMEVVLGYDDTDGSFDYLTTAVNDTSTANWHFKITFPNKQSSGGTDAIFYFSGKVMTDIKTLAGANDVVTRNVTVGIETAIVNVKST